MDELAGRWARLPIRVRLTTWYVLLVALTVALFGLFLHVQLERRLVAALDDSLQVVAAQTLTNLEIEDGQPSLEHNQIDPALLRGEETTLALRLLDGEGRLIEGQGAYRALPPPTISTPPLRSVGEGDHGWRLLRRPLPTREGATGWLEVAQSLGAVEETLENLRDQLFLGVPLLLLFAAAGGYFLAGRLLSPIDRMTRTAQGIGAGDLSRRLHYEGAADEIGRLAHTFDGMLARLEAAFAQERRFTADAAHELRTPLTVLKGQLEVTLQRPRPAEEYRRTLVALGEQVERLIRLGSDLLFLSRVERAPAPAPEPVALAPLLASVLEQMGPLAAQSDITLEQEMTTDVTVSGTPDHLIRLFLNLLHNAVAYTPAGGTARVVLARRGEWAVVAVQDSGPGIPAAALPQLFDRFYRAQEDRSRQSGGAGLGLAIAREIVQRHGGRIGVNSEIGVGSTFTVELPLAGPS